jgi:hypothetical protein
MSKSQTITGRPSGTTQPTAAAKPKNESTASSSDDIEGREARISEAAFFKAAARAFAPGHEWEDWLAAEKEIDGTSKETGQANTSSEALRPDPNSRIWSS